MSKIIDRTGKGSKISQSENDANLSTLAGKNQVVSGTTHTVVIADQGETLELTNSGTKTVTLTEIQNGSNGLLDDAHTDDFTVTLINVGAGDATINRSSTDTFSDGTTSLTLKQYECVVIQTDSTQAIWNILSRTPDYLNDMTHVIDDDTMATASSTTLATSESIKAYADSILSGMNVNSLHVGIIDATAGTITGAGVSGWTVTNTGFPCTVTHSKGHFDYVPVMTINATVAGQMGDVTVAAKTANSFTFSVNGATLGVRVFLILADYN